MIRWQRICHASDFRSKERYRLAPLTAQTDTRLAPAAFILFPLWLAEPGIENTPQRSQCWSDRTRPDLDQIDILGIPRRWFHVQFVQRRAATKRERRRQVTLRIDLHQSPTDDKILFDLEILYPRYSGAPGSDVVPRDHASDSTSPFTRISQSPARRARARFAPGTRGVQSLAFSCTYTFSTEARSFAPTSSRR